MKLKVRIYRGFLEDKRISMEQYANYLSKYMNKLYNKDIDVSSYTPTMFLSKILPKKLKMRFARYFEYPIQIKMNKSHDINHIVEQGYGHLIGNPLYSSATVVTVHDIIPLLAWKNVISGMSYPHRPRLAEYSLKGLKKAAHIIVCSHNTKKDLIKYCGCKGNKVSVIYPGCDEIFKSYPKYKKNFLKYKKFKFPKSSFLILITGSGDYKNHEISIKVFKSLIKYKKNIYLLRLGQKNNNWDNLIKKYSIKKYIIELNSLTSYEVAELYNVVDCLLFPSLYEGFGMPPLEAMACGTPVIASNAGSLPEVIGKAGLLYNPNDIVGLSNGIKLIIKDKTKRNQMIKKGFYQASKFTWDKHLKETTNVYKKLQKLQKLQK